MEQADTETLDRSNWGVRLFHGPMTGPGRWAGTSILEITGDTAQPRATLSTSPPRQNPTTMALPREPDGSYTWTGPHHRRFQVSVRGTYAL